MLAMLIFLWLSVFGNVAIYAELFGDGGLATAVQQNMSTALFAMLEAYLFGAVASVVGIIVVVTFFATSSDSGSLVIDIITSGGNTNSPMI